MTADESEAVAPTRTLEYSFAPRESGYVGPVGREYLEAVVAASHEEPAPFVATLDDELAVLRVLDAAYESAASEDPGNWVTVRRG
jgi:predicted dehydrogenase